MGWVRAVRGVRRLTRSRHDPIFLSQDVEIGEGVKFGRNVRFNSDRVRLGDGVAIGDNVRVDAESIEVGDYATVYADCFFPGPGSLKVGHNFWLGRACIVDSMGGTTIGNNVGVGPQSQLWTHMIFGDVLYGCRFHSTRGLEIGNDVWLVGHCLVSPIRAGDRSLAMLGSLVTKDMEADRCYAGCPAADVTEKVGPQFSPRPVEERAALLREKIGEFARGSELEPSQVAAVVTEWEPETSPRPGITVFNVNDRTYAKLGTPLERALMRFLLPDAKFVPRGG